MSKGITMNFSMVDNQNGECNMGFKCQSSEGIDIDYNIAGEDPESMIEELLNDVSEDIIKQYTEIAKKEKAEAEKKAAKEEASKTPREKELEEIVKKLQKENASLKIDNKILQKRSDTKVNKEMNKPKKEKPKANTSRFFFDDDDLLNLLKIYF